MPSGRPVPTTFELVEATALHHPDRPALFEGHAPMTYRSLWIGIVRLTRMLQRLGVRRGQRVAVSRARWPVELLLLIACENVGAVSCSFSADGKIDPDAQALFKLVDWVFADRALPCPPRVKFQLVDADFMRTVGGLPHEDGTAYPRVALEPDEPQRITRTSGSTGRSKFMLLTRKAQEYWVQRAADTGGYDAQSRLLLKGPMIMNVAYVRACACLRAGGAVVEIAAPQIGDMALTHVWGVPALFERFMDALPPGYRSTRQVAVGTGGGPLSARLRARALEVFGGEITNRYGGNEAGWICDDLDAGGNGWLTAGADVRILDAAGRELPLGEYGAIVVRTPAMAEGYLNDPAATAAAFRDGWFHTGDWGALTAPRRLHMRGRHDDLLNFGGVKMPASRMEDEVRRLAGVADCAALAVNLASGDATLGLAVVASGVVPRGELVPNVQRTVAALVRSHARLVFIDELPRLANGKLDRIALQRVFAAGGDATS